MDYLDASLTVELHHDADVRDGASKAAWCRDKGVSRSTYYRHRARIQTEGRWAPRSRRPRSSPGRTPAPVEGEIVRLRGTLGRDNGAESIRYRLRFIAEREDWQARGWRVPSRATIHKVLLRHGLVTPEPRKRPKKTRRRFAYARARDCYQIDGTQVTLAGGEKVVVLEVLDDATRTLVASHVADSETADAAIVAITAAFTEYGVPAIVLSDNGTAFTSRKTTGGVSRFTRTVTKAGARLIHSSPYHPQTCGKVERHHRTFKGWLADHPDGLPATAAELQTRCDEYRAYYNTERYHSAIKTTPRQAWDDCPKLGGPKHLPVQRDATVHTLKVSSNGVVGLGATSISIGRHRAGHTITVLRDGDHITAYDRTGTPLGHLHLDHDQRYQGQLRPAA